MRDLGQYFTNREVIEWMVKLTDPKIANKKTGEIEKILDPSMGTGGFLTMAIKHLNETNKNINWDKNKDNIYGFDIDENVTQMSLLNVFIETGKLFDKTIIQHDSLHKDYMIDEKTLIDKVDVILANEPFGLKNIVHAECCDRIKELKIRGTKAEPLFLQLMMLSLNEGGRCAVVVPDGVLFNDSNLHTGTREYLVSNLNLKKVTSLNGDFFLNTGVKSSVLYFVNDGSTSQVEFSELVMDGGKLKENFICKVGLKDIVANGYSLFVNKYNTTEEKKLDGIKYMKLGDICELKNGKNITKADLLEGPYPVYGGGQTPMGYHNQHNTEESKIIVSKIGEYAGFVNILKTKCYVTSNGFSLNIISTIINVDNKYLYYYLKNIQNKIYACQEQTGQPKLNSTMFLELQIPIPSMEKQMEIVETLDVFYEQIERNNQSIKAYERIKKGIVWANTTNCDNMKKLGDICEFKSGKFNSRDSKSEGKYPFYSSEANNPVGFIDDYCFDYNEYLILIKDGGAGKGKYGDQIGLGKVFKVFGKSSATSHQLAIVPSQKFNVDYLYFYLQFIKNKIMDLAQYTTGLGTIKKSEIENIKIPIPSKEIQESIVKECEYWDEQINRLKKENEKLKAVPVIELCLASESKNDLDQTNNQVDDEPETILEEDHQENIEPNDQSEDEKYIRPKEKPQKVKPVKVKKTKTVVESDEEPVEKVKPVKVKKTKQVMESDDEEPQKKPLTTSVKKSKSKEIVL